MTTDNPADASPARATHPGPLSRPFDTDHKVKPMSSDFARELFDARGTPDGAHALRMMAPSIAQGLIAESRHAHEREMQLKALAALVLNQRPEAKKMAGDVIAGRVPEVQPDFEMRNGRARITIREWPNVVLMQGIHAIFEDVPALNYVEHVVTSPNPNEPGFLVTIQRETRPLPGDLHAEAKERADAAEARLADALAEVETLRGQIAQSSERGVPWLSQPPDAAMVKAHAEAHPWQPAREGRERAIPAAGLWQVRWREKGTSLYGGTTVSVGPNPAGNPVAFDMTGSLTPVEKYAEQLGADLCEWRPLTADHEPVCEHLRAVERKAAPLVPVQAMPAVKSAEEIERARVGTSDHPSPTTADGGPTIAVYPAHAAPEGIAAAVRDAIGAAQTPTTENAQLSDHTPTTPESGDAGSRRALARRLNGQGLAFVASHYLGLDVPQCQKNWYADLDTHKRLVMLLPRCHGATTIARVLVLRAILANHNVRVLFLSGGAPEGIDFVGQTRAALDDEKVRSDRAVNAPYVSSAGRRLYAGDDPVTPTMRAARWSDELPEGEQYDLIVGDTIRAVCPAHTLEAARMDADRVRDVLLPRLAEGGRIVFVGPGACGAESYDAIARIDGFMVVSENAVVKWPAEGGPDNTGRALWPERWPIERLMETRVDIGGPAFFAAFQHHRAPDEIAQSSEHAAAPPAAPAPALSAAEIAHLPRRRSVAVLVRYPARGYVEPGSAEEQFAAVRVASRGGSIEPAGGKVEDGESAYDAATREAFEELGVQVEVSMQGLGVYEHIHNGCVWHCHFYVGHVLDPALRGGREGEAAWVTRAELTSGAFGALVARALVWLDDRNAPPSCI